MWLRPAGRDYSRVKFDATGQNTEGNPVIQEIKEGAFHTVWPADVATMPVDWAVGQ